MLDTISAILLLLFVFVVLLCAMRGKVSIKSEVPTVHATLMLSILVACAYAAARLLGLIHA